MCIDASVKRSYFGVYHVGSWKGCPESVDRLIADPECITCPRKEGMLVSFTTQPFLIGGRGPIYASIIILIVEA